MPASNKYHSEHNWEKSPTTKTAKFFVTKRRTIADEIEHKSTFKEKTSPGCAEYKNEAAWRFTQAKIKGLYNKSEKRITFVQESGWNADQTPGPYKYKDVDLVSSYLIV